MSYFIKISSCGNIFHRYDLDSLTPGTIIENLGITCWQNKVNTIPDKCFIVADMPVNVSSWVRELRKKADPALIHMPIEVTLTGSSGVGTLVAGQIFERVRKITVDCVSDLLPFEFAFRGMDRFPGKEYYFLDPEPERFQVLHERLAQSELEFEDHSFPYRPHCSVAGYTPVTDREREIIRDAGYPEGSHVVSAISIYRIAKMTPVKLWTYEAE